MSSSTMDNLLPTKPAKALLAYTICLLNLIPIIQAADPTFLFLDCPNTTSTYAPNSTYQTNLNTLFSVLSSNSNASNGFYNFTAGTSPPDVAYGLYLCRGDVSAAVCQDCVGFATTDVVKQCPTSKRATIWYDECMLRYSNQSIFSVPEIGGGVMWNLQNVTNVTRLNEVLGEVMDDIANRASSDDSGKKFATREVNYSLLQPMYGLAQCTPDLSDSQCYTCLRNCISEFPSCCNAKQGGRVLFHSCNVRYEMYPFYNVSFGAASPPPSPVLPPPPPPPPTTTTTIRSRGNGGISSQVIIAIVVPTGVAIMLFIAGFFWLTRRAKKKYNSVKQDNVGDDMSTVKSLQYDLGTVQAATNNFSDDNIIGEGGFGQVYKGLLPDGQQVAVKRLSKTSGQDFGMARIFGVDQTHGSTRQVVGTFGYMSPERCYRPSKLCLETLE
ncbi:hypothetical protein Vadar_013398 [Vaccinium darrowii]|uniref:Uncharacterized protein n=1 Tax=Vaccinium darrowii TaxID=229202 RepID=A0ACB7X9X0_9ERIC|nr:hypothetical protein Vadar_013398 [Vaccinium darrowii]